MWRAAALLVALLSGPACQACELVLSTSPRDEERARWPLRPRAFSLSFNHSVLGTEVRDDYEVRAQRITLVRETFEGEGYGLPAAAQPGERLDHSGSRSVLHTQRTMNPLIVRPSRAQRTRLHLGTQAVLLADVHEGALKFTLEGCSP